MLILIDLHDAQKEPQSPIGKYALSIAKAIAINNRGHNIIISLSGSSEYYAEKIRLAFHDLIPNENIRFWHAPLYEEWSGSDDKDFFAIIEQIQTAFIANIKPDLVFFPGLPLFSFINPSINLKLFVSTIPTAVVAHKAFFNKKQQNKTKYQQIKRCLMDSSLCILPPSIKQEDFDQTLSLNKDKLFLGGIDCEKDSGQDAFSEEATRILHVFEDLTKKRKNITRLTTHHHCRPRMAYVSPIPPTQSGIADYSEKLLSELSNYYDIEIIIQDKDFSNAAKPFSHTIRLASWFYRNGYRYDRIIYHFGNSPYHSHMHKLLRNFPGVVVLHDFYLGDLTYYKENVDGETNFFLNSLYGSHGYNALIDFSCYKNDITKVLNKYPCNFEVIKYALGVIVHSSDVLHLVQSWYGQNGLKKFVRIPMLYTQTPYKDRITARKNLNISENIFALASFGVLGENKLTKDILQAFTEFSSTYDKQCHLFLVGKFGSQKYEKEIQEIINKSKIKDKVTITGWVDIDTYQNYLAAIDITIQLRGNSRGETSAALFDVLGTGIPTILNKYGSMAEIPNDVALPIEKEVSTSELITAIEKLASDKKLRKSIGANAKIYLSKNNTLEVIAKQYSLEIEKFYSSNSFIQQNLLLEVSKLIEDIDNKEQIKCLATSIAATFPSLQSKKHSIFIDVSATCQNDLKTGIQRVVRALMLELLKTDSPSYRIEPIYLSDAGNKWHFRYAYQYTLESIGISPHHIHDEPVEFKSGDILLGADFISGMLPEAERCSRIYTNLKNRGIKIYFVIYDILPIEFPSMFPMGVDNVHKQWLTSIYDIADGALCISKSVMESVSSWLKEKHTIKKSPFSLDWFHLGADIENSIPSTGVPQNAKDISKALKSRPSFLIVGTIEPRKGVSQVLDAFDLLQATNAECNLMIVGKQGWQVDSLCKKIKAHKNLNKRLFWLEAISDEFLEKIYESSTCLIAASAGEGFGLPLIEGAQHKLPIIARDIPVFREVAGEFAYYFDGTSAEDLASALTKWLELYKSNAHPKSDDMPWLTWKESAEQLLSAIFSES